MPLAAGRDAQALSDNPENVRGDNPEGLEEPKWHEAMMKASPLYKASAIDGCLQTSKKGGDKKMIRCKQFRLSVLYV